LKTGSRRSEKRDPWSTALAGRRNSRQYTGRHAVPRDPGLRARTRALRPGKVAPAVATAAALAVGGSVYGLTGSGMLGSAQGTLTAEMLSVPSGAQVTALPVAGSWGAATAGSARIQVAAHQALHRAATHAAPSRSARPSPSATTVSCSANRGLLPYNMTAIVNFLLKHGYSRAAAAGIAGNIYQESKGDPESVGMGGGGLIGFTPLPSGYVTGNAAADLQTQLNAILTYNQLWSAYLPSLNKASSPTSAAYIYVTYFERAGIPVLSTREASARAVAASCGL
jgi:hypothetical protein